MVAMAATGGLLLFLGIGLFFQHLYPVGVPQGITLPEYRSLPVIVIVAGVVLVELATFAYMTGRRRARVT